MAIYFAIHLKRFPTTAASRFNARNLLKNPTSNTLRDASSSRVHVLSFTFEVAPRSKRVHAHEPFTFAKEQMEYASRTSKPSENMLFSCKHRIYMRTQVRSMRMRSGRLNWLTKSGGGIPVAPTRNTNLGGTVDDWQIGIGMHAFYKVRMSHWPTNRKRHAALNFTNECTRQGHKPDFLSYFRTMRGRSNEHRPCTSAMSSTWIHP